MCDRVFACSTCTPILGVTLGTAEKTCATATPPNETLPGFKFGRYFKTLQGPGLAYIFFCWVTLAKSYTCIWGRFIFRLLAKSKWRLVFWGTPHLENSLRPFEQNKAGFWALGTPQNFDFWGTPPPQNLWVDFGPPPQIQTQNPTLNKIDCFQLEPWQFKNHHGGSNDGR